VYVFQAIADKQTDKQMKSIIA